MSLIQQRERSSLFESPNFIHFALTTFSRLFRVSWGLNAQLVITREGERFGHPSLAPKLLRILTPSVSCLYPLTIYPRSPVAQVQGCVYSSY